MSRKQTVAAALGLAAVAVPGAALAAHVNPHGTYTGTTSQVNETGMHAQIAFNAARHARKIAKLSIQVRVDCDSGTPQYFVLPGANEKIDSPGRFSDSGTITGDVEGGRKGTVTAVLHGRFTSARKAVGTFSATEDIADTTGAVVDHCRSGNVTWSAKRAS
jgi:hypothetical protein